MFFFKNEKWRNLILGSIISYDTTPPCKSLILLAFIFALSNDLKRGVRSAPEGGNALTKKRGSDRPKETRNEPQK